MRVLFVAIWLAVSFVRPVAAQSASVTFSVGLDQTIQRNGARMPVVQLRNLLADERWGRELDNSLPLILTFQVETWRSRDGWIDELLGTVSWQIIVNKQPLQEEYSVTLIVQEQVARPDRFGVRDSAAAFLNRLQRVETFPERVGRFYYHGRARITVLSDRDLDQLERFLAGDPDIDIPARGTQLGRGLRRFLLQIAGLPSQTLEQRSEVFETRAPDEQ